MCLAYPAQVISVGADVAEVEVAGRCQHVITICLEGGPPVPGDWLLIHSGLAVSRLSLEELHELSR
jgi:hydrogenase expression/formation protein HypC